MRVHNNQNNELKDHDILGLLALSPAPHNPNIIFYNGTLSHRVISFNDNPFPWSFFPMTIYFQVDNYQLQEELY